VWVAWGVVVMITRATYAVRMFPCGCAAAST